MSHNLIFVKMLKRSNDPNECSSSIQLMMHAQTGKQYILKQTEIANREDLERAQRESNLLIQLAHPNLIRGIDSWQSGLQFSLLLEYAEHGDLENFIRQRKEGFSEFESSCIILQLLLVTNYLHQNQILHRDIKTKNIFIVSFIVSGNDENGNDKRVGIGMGENSLIPRIKLGDLGIARKLDTWNMAETAIGTPYYLCPELCQLKPYGYKSDVWSIGCVGYELMTLKRPFQADTFSQLVHKILYSPIEKLPFLERGKEMEFNDNGNGNVEEFNHFNDEIDKKWKREEEESKVKGIKRGELSRLVEKMLVKQANDRPSIQECLSTNLMRQTAKLLDNLLKNQNSKSFDCHQKDKKLLKKPLLNSHSSVSASHSSIPSVPSSSLHSACNSHSSMEFPLDFEEYFEKLAIIHGPEGAANIIIEGKKEKSNYWKQKAFESWSKSPFQFPSKDGRGKE